jgi:tetratricopeptide (TPR) repeat protein
LVRIELFIIGYSRMIMALCHRRSGSVAFVLTLVSGVVLLSASSSARTAAPSREGRASLAAANRALRAGDCGQASSLLRDLALQEQEVEIAERATAVALSCGQYAAAASAAARWRTLAPGEDPPALLELRAELQAWRIPEARAQFTAWVGKGRSDLAKRIGQLADDAGNEATHAMLRDLDIAPLRDAAVQAQLAELAMSAGDAASALRHAQAARAAGASQPAMAALQSRAQAVLGNGEAALAAAREAAADPKAQLAPAEVLQLLDREPEAEAALQELRNDPEVGVQAGRELAQIALERADYPVVEERCNTLLQEKTGQVTAVFMLGIVAERRGDEERALRSYRLLGGTAYGQQARRRAALMILRGGDKESGLRMLAAGRDADPAERIRAELAIAELLSASGAPAEALARVKAELARSPGHPELEYQQAVLLERTGQGDAAIALLESLHKARPLDTGVSNALGYTMADHKRDLPRAEAFVREALASQPDNPAILDSLGWVLFRRGQAEAALVPLRRAFRLFKDGDIGAHLGEVLLATGHKPEARAVLQRALAADPDNAALAATAARLVPGLGVPKPPPALEPATRTSI